MCLEIERKFIVNSVPKRLVSQREEIEQIYLSLSPDIRVRKSTSDPMIPPIHVLTLKHGEGMVRNEVSIFLDITPEKYNELRLVSIGSPILKTRYTIPHEYEVIVDEYHGKLSGLIVAEVEFPDIESANNFEPFEWMAKEVTDDSRYQNKVLAICGLDEVSA